jgi:hypothetical protein
MIKKEIKTLLQDFVKDKTKIKVSNKSNNIEPSYKIKDSKVIFANGLIIKFDENGKGKVIEKGDFLNCYNYTELASIMRYAGEVYYNHLKNK